MKYIVLIGLEAGCGGATAVGGYATANCNGQSVTAQGASSASSGPGANAYAEGGTASCK